MAIHISGSEVTPMGEKVKSATRLVWVKFSVLTDPFSRFAGSHGVPHPFCCNHWQIIESARGIPG